MTHNNNSVQRTAPIPIAPKPPRPEPVSHRQDSLRRFEVGPASLQTRASTDSVSASAPAPSNTQSLPPCRACRYTGTRCIPSEDDDGCMSCQVNAAECSLSSSPQSRKRKPNGDPYHEISGKRRFVICDCFTQSPFVTPSAIPPFSSLSSTHTCMLSFRSPSKIPGSILLYSSSTRVEFPRWAIPACMRETSWLDG